MFSPYSNISDLWGRDSPYRDIADLVSRDLQCGMGAWHQFQDRHLKQIDHPTTNIEHRRLRYDSSPNVLRAHYASAGKSGVLVAAKTTKKREFHPERRDE
ncbi:hypothetical protein CDAR_240661 [Caerostris darwini]|uniref:Uncharacterized protein n=1 Tax=Caerostris darwini TaxID=1538125 RepID=A0AAV4RBM6_9ARAC|nr:hypothetical protein CDAR_240661 [Caerostris darwini]